MLGVSVVLRSFLQGCYMVGTLPVAAIPRLHNEQPGFLSDL